MAHEAQISDVALQKTDGKSPSHWRAAAQGLGVSTV